MAILINLILLICLCVYLAVAEAPEDLSGSIVEVGILEVGTWRWTLQSHCGINRLDLVEIVDDVLCFDGLDGRQWGRLRTAPEEPNRSRGSARRTRRVRYNSILIIAGELRHLDSPFKAVRIKALVYLLIEEVGILIFIGGEVPSVVSESNATYTSNSWNYAQVYDVSARKWFNRRTLDTVVQRKTEFCAIVQHDAPSTAYLSIPPVKWYHARSLDHERMSHVYEA
ncbi:hypothetical protein BDV38DRAFT_288025 [Aspergillus pseudotamarii]|uniref:Uncharacterized protein n=1 Tax=Aspergillus pseudotamarii TaxID=132259 RepID=A0A5N6SBK9_ASPPS|nr:uncharacterized protein BDV38DRAFT_288025 [Aspergillus pseudotamarii]KAE8132096.1 hypothetical protein BDV38DRAFT_288025 [Aspergillus pseudotamarii]